MANIDILTSQKVNVSYELATVMDRIFAWFIDIVIISFSILLFSLFAGLTMPGNIAEYFNFTIGIVVFFFYTPFFEISLHGQTPGKKAMNLRVVKIDGSRATVYEYIIRWAFRMIDIYFTLGLLAILFINSTPHRQRIGDLLSHMSVIKQNSSVWFSLKDILSISNKENHAITYPDVRNLNEEEVLLIKEALDRYKKYPNEAHNESLDMLCDAVAGKLGLKAPNEKIRFLNTVLKDFVVATR